MDGSAVSQIATVRSNSADDVKTANKVFSQSNYSDWTLKQRQLQFVSVCAAALPDLVLTVHEDSETTRLLILTCDLCEQEQEFSNRH